MILRYDRIAMELPPPSDPDPAGAAAVQELMGGRFGEMSTFLNYTFQSFNFRGRQGARPFYDLVANIAAEEFGHVELVAAAINTMLTGASATSNGRARSPLATRTPLADMKGIGNPHHFLAGGQGALPQNSQGRPWNGDYVFSSGDLVEDLTHNFFLETGARNNKLKVYEMVEHPAARALTGYLLVRGGVHQIAYARAVENLTGADLSKMFPTPRIPTEKIPECKPHIERGDHLRLYRFSPDDYQELAAVFNWTKPGNRRGSRRVRRGSRRGAPARPPGAARCVRTRCRTGGDCRDRPEATGEGRFAQGAYGSRCRPKVADQAFDQKGQFALEDPLEVAVGILDPVSRLSDRGVRLERAGRPGEGERLASEQAASSIASTRRSSASAGSSSRTSPIIASAASRSRKNSTTFSVWALTTP